MYYKVPAAGAEAALAEVRRAHEALRTQWPGLHCDLLRRPQLPDPQTWMETYRHPHGVGSALLGAIEQALHDLPNSRLGERHVEIFVPIDAGGPG